MRPVAAKVHDETYDIILYEAAKCGVTVSIIVRRALEQTFGPHDGNLKGTAQERRP
jgi:hypothetical protein